MKNIVKITACTLAVMSFAVNGAFAAGYSTFKESNIPYGKTLIKEENKNGTEIKTYSTKNLGNYSMGYTVLIDSEDNYYNGQFGGKNKEDKRTVIDLDGNEVNIGDYDFMDWRIDKFGGVSVSKKGENHYDYWGYIGLADGIVIPCSYDKIERCDENIFRSGNYLFFDKDGNTVFDGYEIGGEDGTYDYVGNNIFRQTVVQWGDSGWDGNEYIQDMDAVTVKYYDINGNVIKSEVSEYPPSYYEHENLTLESQNYGYLQSTDGTYFCAKLDGKYGIIDRDENIIVPFVFDVMGEETGGYVWAANEGENWKLLSLSADAVSVSVDGDALTFDQAPLIIEGRTFVPLRAIFEKLGAKVEWDGETRTITSKKGDTSVSMTIDKNIMTVNNDEKELDTAPKIVNGRTLVPVRAVAEAFSCSVDRNGETNTVIITQK